MRRWERAKAGEGQVVLISGEPGIGKSRLARELQERIADEPNYRLRHQCSPYHTNSALYPIIERLERAAGFESGDEAGTKLAKLEALIDLSDNPNEETASLFASLLSIPAGERYPRLNVGPQRRKELTLGALVDQLAGIAATRPVLFVLEDAHWIDPTTLELMELVVERATEAAVLLLITYRPAFDAPWIGRPRVTPMILGRLERRDCERMVAGVTGEAILPDDVRDRISEQTDGVPLFIEELTRSVLETADRAAAIAVPATLQDSLEARLDRLGPAKEIAQIGAVIGREFDFRLLSRVAPVEGGALLAALEELVRSGLISVRGEPPDAAYTFKHALVRDTAYDGMLRNRRRELHGRTARVIEEAHARSGAPEILAHHFTQAGETKSALPYWIEAGTQAVRHSANAEAINYFETAIDLVRALPDSVDRARQELDLLSAMSPATIGKYGLGAPEIRDVHESALALADRVGDSTDKLRALFGLWIFNATGMNLEEARNISRQMVQLADASGDSGHELQAQHTIWSTDFLSGDVDACYRSVQEGVRLYDKEKHGTHAPMYGGHDPGVCAFNFRSMSSWVLGYPDQARQSADLSIRLADELGHDFSVAISLTFGSQILLLLGELNEAANRAERGRKLCAELGIPFHDLFHSIQSLVGLSAGGPASSLDDVLREILTPWGPGHEMFRTYWLCVTARAFGRSGRLNEAADILEEAEKLAVRFGQNWAHPEVTRHRGELLQFQDAPDKRIEACFVEALERARHLKAKSWELRAAISLAKLGRNQGKSTPAKEVLAPVYDWFTEGFETADLKEAKALLDEVG